MGVAPASLRDKRPSERQSAIDQQGVEGALAVSAGGTRVDAGGLHVGDVRLSARRGELQVLGKGADGGKRRTLPVHAELRAALQAWLEERPRWPTAGAGVALLLNRRGGRLSDRSVRTIIGRFGELAGLDADPLDSFALHVLRHTFGTQLVRAGVDLVTVAELMGHARMTATRSPIRRPRLGGA